MMTFLLVKTLFFLSSLFASQSSIEACKTKWLHTLQARLQNPQKKSSFTVMLLVDLPQDLFQKLMGSIPEHVSVALPLQKFSDLQKFFPKRKFWIWVYANTKQALGDGVYEGVVFFPYLPQENNIFSRLIQEKKVFFPDRDAVAALPSKTKVHWGDILIFPSENEEIENEKLKNIQELYQKTHRVCVTVVVQKESQIPKIQKWLKQWMKYVQRR